MNSGIVVAASDDSRHQYQGRAANARHRYNVSTEIELQVRIERHIGGGRRYRNEQQRITIGCRSGDEFGAEIGTCTRPVLDDDSLAKLLGKRRRNNARDDVRLNTGGVADDETDRPGWIIERRRPSRYGRERGCTRRQLQKLSPLKLHDSLPITLSYNGMRTRLVANAHGTANLDR